MISTNICHKKTVKHPIRLILKKLKSKRKNGHGQNFIHDLHFYNISMQVWHLLTLDNGNMF